MTKDEVLTQLTDKKISSQQAYKMLYPKYKERKPRRASFVKLSLNIPESKGINIFLKVLFALPIPIFIIKMVMRRRLKEKISDQVPLTPSELIDLISIKGVKVNVLTKTNEKIKIYTI
ncbi:MAG: hypothetical protein C4537_04605 [Acholeplasma sp.]|jgi:hypothetical protein|nr:MAG: hypothetical protein C4537_04605 [Acholeplasma sp.]